MLRNDNNNNSISPTISIPPPPVGAFWAGSDSGSGRSEGGGGVDSPSARLLFIAPTQIYREASQVRQEGAIYEGAEFEALVNSIRLLGIQQPVTVEEISTSDSAPAPDSSASFSYSYRLVAGHRRHEAALRLGLAQIPCLVMGLGGGNLTGSSFSFKSKSSSSSDSLVSTEAETGTEAGIAATQAAKAEASELVRVGRRVVSQLAENMVRSEMDVLDKAVGLKTAKVLADIERAQEYLAELPLAELGITHLPPLPTTTATIVTASSRGLTTTNAERLAIYEQYLAELVGILTSPKIAEQIANPQVVYPIKNKLGEYALADQALASWQAIEQACGVSKAQRTAVIRLLQVEPALTRLIRQHLATTSATFSSFGSSSSGGGGDMLRSHLEAVLVVPEPCREAVVKTYLGYLADQAQVQGQEEAGTGEGNITSNPAHSSSSSAATSKALKLPVPRLETKVMRLIGECLGRDELRREWQSLQGRVQVDYLRLVTLAAQIPVQSRYFKAEVLSELYFSDLPVGELVAQLLSGQWQGQGQRVDSDQDRPTKSGFSEYGLEASSSLPLDPDFGNGEGSSGTGHAGNQTRPESGNGSRRGTGTGNGSGFRNKGGSSDEGNEDYNPDYDGYGGSSGGGGSDADLDAVEGFSLQGAYGSELPPELLAEVEALKLSEAAIKAIASLGDPTKQRELLAKVREFPHIAGKLRRIVALVRDEGWVLSEALDEALGWVGGKPVLGVGSGESESESGQLQSQGQAGVTGEGNFAINRNPDYNPDEAQAHIISGTQRLLDASSSLEEGLELLRRASHTGKLSDLPEPWGEHSLQLLDQLQFILATFLQEADQLQSQQLLLQPQTEETD